MRALALGLLLAAAGLEAQPDPLADVADALGGRDRVDAVETVETVTRASAELDGERVTLRATRVVRFPDAARWTVRAGGTTRTVEIGPGRPDGTPAAREAQRSLWLDPLVLARRRAEVRAERLGERLLRVEAPGLEAPLLVGLDDAGRPERITTFVDRDGDRRYLEVRVWDYRTVDGLAVPHRVLQSEGGVVLGEGAVEAVRFGVPWADAP